MRSKARWLALSLVVGLAVAACQDGDGDPTPMPTAIATVASAADPTEAPAARGAGSMTFGDEVIALTGALCFFEEQTRAGLGGVYTHTAQGSGTNAAGDDVILDVSRARDEDGTEGDDVLVDIGELGSDEAKSFGAAGPAMVTFGDASATADEIALRDSDAFDQDPVSLSFELNC